MRQSSRFHATLALVMALWLWLAGPIAQAGEPVVRAVLFYSPSCGHCHQVITEDLPPLFEKYSERLHIIGINIADEGGSALFDAAGEKFGIPPENRGVPLLVVDDVVLIGSLDIPGQFPGLIEKYLAEGGVGWPDIPGLAEALAQAEAAQQTPTPSPPAPSVDASLPAPTLVPTLTPTAARAVTPTPTPGLLLAGGSSDGFGARFSRDPTGNGLAVVVLAAMLAVFTWVIARRPWRSWDERSSGSRSWRDVVVPLLCLIGLGVAGYLAFVETQQVEAVCGPVGDCNSVQQSPYARLFGLLPIGVLGVLGYLAVLTVWMVQRVSSGTLRRWARIALLAILAIGVLFSIYLTFLEPFVIGATCAWCLSSAVIMTLLLVLTALPPGTELAAESAHAVAGELGAD